MNNGVYPKTSLGSFSFSFYMVDNEGPAIEATCNWMSYIGASYENVQELQIEYCDYDNPIDYARVLDALNIAMIDLDQIKKKFYPRESISHITCI